MPSCSRLPKTNTSYLSSTFSAALIRSLKAILAYTLMEHVSNTENAFGEAWSVATTEHPPLNPDASLRSGQRVRAYAPADRQVSSLRRPERVYLERNRRYAPPSIISVTQDPRQLTTRSSLEIFRSYASSGISVQEVEVPGRILEAHRSPGNYKCVVTNFTPFTESTDSLLQEKAPEFGYSLQPLESFSDKIAYTEQLAALTAAHTLPTLKGPVWWRRLRHEYCSAYRTLCALVTISNVVLLLLCIRQTVKHPNDFGYEQAATATGANLLIATLCRHEHVVNLLFRMACALPWWTPLSIRKRAAKVYSYGGVHSGCGISAFLWYIFYSVLAVAQYKGSPAEERALAATVAASMMLLALIICTAHPLIRKRWHNQWELSHRYGGWTAVALIWAQTLLLIISRATRRPSHSLSRVLTTTPTFWFLVFITTCLVYPWLRLRRHAVEAEKLSSHAVRLHVRDKKLPTCVGYRVSHNPLSENHGFATIPNSDGQKGFSMVVSNAGDWTKSLIDSPPTHIWTRGAPTIGVMRIASLFRPVIVVATGSGIGPALSFLQVHPDHPVRIVWSARFPEVTYGHEIMKAVLRADRRALIIDTKKTGHPNLPALTFAMYAAMGAEAVVVISNPNVTKLVVYEMEARGVPAFGPIFDS